jgi:D-lactate dehydrogenase
LQALFRAHGYDEAVIFGHAKDGNLHFVITQSFSEEASIRQFNDFMQGLVELVVDRYDGALKAEHGTGRNVSAFVAREWGDKAYGIMKEIKHLFDPEGYLNPGVLINPDPLAHVKDLKTMPLVESEVDRCIECGFCESHCPSRRLTLTPRQRIVLRRAMAGDELRDNPEILAAMQADYQYAGLDTCAVDGLCEPACPVKINTGDLVKRLRAEATSPLSNALAERASANFKFVEMGLRSIVAAAHGLEALVGPEPLTGLSRFGERLSTGRLPKWNRAVPYASRDDLPHTNRDGAAAVYFPACITRIMGRPSLDGESDSLITVLLRLAEKAGLSLWIPPDVEGVCCGMPFSSKGYTKAHKKMISHSLERFWEWTDAGRLPLVIDASSCAYSLLTGMDASDPDSAERWRALRVLDPVEFAHDVLLPRLAIERQPIEVVLHPNCALRKMNGADKMIALAQACARAIHVPAKLDCCGFAGDRGLLFPELTASATELEAAEVLSGTFDGYYSSNLTCEMGMSLATGKPYRSILYLLDQATDKDTAMQSAAHGS